MGSLITGIGYIGAWLAHLLLDSGEQVVGLDNLFSTAPGAIERLAGRPGFTFVQGDVRNEQDVSAAFSTGVAIDTVYHLAAQASANPSAAASRYTEETNLIGPRIVLDEAVKAGTRVLVFGSSLQVYGRRVEGSVSEGRPYGPILDLSHLSKVHVEKLMEMYSINSSIACTSARIGLVYGLGPVFKTDPTFMTAPNKFCMQAVAGNPIRLNEGAYLPTGMIHVEDAARGLAALARHAAGYRAVNLPGETASVTGVANLVQILAARRGLEVRVEAPMALPSVPAVDFPSAAGEFGFTPRWSLEEGVAEVLDHFFAFARSGAPASFAGSGQTAPTGEAAP